MQRHLQNAGNPAGDGSRFVYNIRIISLSFPETMGARLIVPLCVYVLFASADINWLYCLDYRMGGGKREKVTEKIGLLHLTNNSINAQCVCI